MRSTDMFANPRYAFAGEYEKKVSPFMFNLKNADGLQSGGI